MILRAGLEVEMRKRKIAFSVGDVGEQLAIEYFRNTPGLKLQLGAPGTKNVDANSRDGDRYSIKTICRSKKTSTIYPDPNDRKRQLFEYLLIVRLSENWSLHSIYRFPWRQFVKIRLWDKRMGAWYVGCSAKTLNKAELIYTA